MLMKITLMDLPTTVTPEQVQPIEHTFTPANIATGLRPILAAEVARRLIVGETGATKVMALVMISDKEGDLARGVDKLKEGDPDAPFTKLLNKILPGPGWGVTEKGKVGDPVADSLAMAEISAGALKGPRVSFLGKLAVGIVLGAETVKTGWFARASKKHKEATGEQLVLPVSSAGKKIYRAQVRCYRWCRTY
ncbi:MAG: hypothetical protein JWM81_506 [Candidatus Saccharibacteria bacterium]|nr:hypothetical protein [Candidatus Saccharibacteria bacterium]